MLAVAAMYNLLDILDFAEFVYLQMYPVTDEEEISELEAISNQLDDIQQQIDDQTFEILSAISLNEIILYKSKIEAVINRQKQKLKITTNETIIEDMNDILRRDDDIDFLLMDFLTRIEHGENSAIKQFSDKAKMMIRSDKNKLKYSISSFVFHFQLTAYFSALKYVSVFELATKVKNKFEEKDFKEDFWKIRKEDLKEQFKKSLQQASKYTNDAISLSSLINLNSNDIPTYKFEIVFQNYLINEYYVSYETTCKNDCKFNKYIPVKNDNCDGFIGNCQLEERFGYQILRSQYGSTLKKGNKDYVAYYPNDERIYYWYQLEHQKRGMQVNHAKMTMLEEFFYLTWMEDCEMCLCTCDQRNKKSTVRRIYGGVVSVPIGFVVTGIRFAMDQNIIHLQLQYGKLVSEGTVDPKSLQWTEIPEDITQNTLTITFDLRKFSLDDVYFNDGTILTGVQFFAHDGFIRTRIFGSKVKKDENSLQKEVKSHNLSHKPKQFKISNGIKGINSVFNHLIIKRSDSNEKLSIFFTTDNEDQNAGQETVPYFDGSDIIQDFPLVLSGIGFIHYTNENYAGYLRPILKSVDMKHMF